MEDSAKKSVESASSGSAILKLYNKWHEKLVTGEGGEEEGRTTTSGKEKKGLLSKVKTKKSQVSCKGWSVRAAATTDWVYM